MTAPSSTVEGGEQRGCAMALVVVGDAFDVAEPHGQHGLGAFKGLDLAHMGICGSRSSDQDSMINLRSRFAPYPRSEPACMTRPCFRCRFKLTSGRRSHRPHQYPACVGRGLRRAGPFSSSAF